MLYIDRTAGRRERWFLGGKPANCAMRVNNETLGAVLFVCRRRKTTGAYQAVATAWLVSVPNGPDDRFRQAYLVTARHAIDLAQRGDGHVHLRVNTAAGGVRYVQVVGEWWAPDDPGVDVAVCPFDHVPELDVIALDMSLFATDDIIGAYEVGIGDELSVIGLFTSVIGQQRNRPIVRAGTIAAMPDEPIIEPEEPPYYAYLAEMRSTGGLSGSPVAVMLGYDRDAEGKRMRQGPSFIIGLIRGHWPAPSTGAITVLSDDHGQVNRGIATVTPIHYVTDLLSSEVAVKDRLRRLRALAEEEGLSSVSDAVDEPDVNEHRTAVQREDVNTTAFRVMQEATGERPKTCPPVGKPDPTKAAAERATKKRQGRPKP